MRGFVLDASFCLTWCFPDEDSPHSRALLERLQDEAAAVPALFYLEVCNGLLFAERRGRLTRTQLLDFMGLLNALPLVTDEEAPFRVFDVIYALAHEEQLTVYDATYLELAMRYCVPLATRDGRLVRSAERQGVPVLGLPL